MVLATYTQRLQSVIAAVAPIDGVSVGTFGDSSTVRIDFKAAATANQRTAAQSALTSFDWSADAQATWEDAQSPNRTSLRSAAVSAFTANTTFLGIATPTAAQVRDQTIALTQQMNKVLKRLAEL